MNFNFGGQGRNSDKNYLQMFSDPILCKAEKGFAAESSPKNSRSFPLWKTNFSFIIIAIFIIAITVDYTCAAGAMSR